MGYNIEYWSNRASDAHPTLLTVSLADPARLVVGSNADNPGPEPVGTFLAMPPAAEADALMQAARRLVHSPNPAIGPAIPGEEIRKLTIALDSGPQETRLATESSPPDQPFLAAETAAIAVAKALRLHPKAALSAQMTLRLDGAGHVEVALKVVNVGLDTVTIPHPDFWADGSVSIQVVTRRNDVALSELPERTSTVCGSHQGSARRHESIARPISNHCDRAASGSHVQVRGCLGPTQRQLRCLAGA